MLQNGVGSSNLAGCPVRERFWSLVTKSVQCTFRLPVTLHYANSLGHCMHKHHRLRFSRLIIVLIDEQRVVNHGQTDSGF